MWKMVENGANLTIEAGCEIIFRGKFGLYIGNGTLTAVGNPSSMITFTTSNATNHTWDRIQINATGQARISYCNLTGQARISYCNLTYGDYTIFMDYSSGNVIENNNINDSFNYGIFLSWSTDNIIQNNSIWYNGWHGIHLYHGVNNIVKNNTVHHNFRGVYLSFSENNNITRNNIYSNWYDGIYLISLSDSNNITKNNVSTNDVSGDGNYGIYLSSCSDNRIYHNIFWNNTNQSFDDDVNFWNLTYPIGGNYWSDFDEPNEGAYDNLSGPMQDIVGGDGIVDYRYTKIDNGTEPNPKSYDNYPLMNPSVVRFFAYLNSPTNNSVVKPGTVLDFIIVGDDIDFVNYTINGGPNNTFDPSWDINETETGTWSDGPYIIEIQLFDLPGNMMEFWFNITIDSVLPEIILNSPDNGSLIGRGDTIDLTVTDLHLNNVSYSLDGGVNISLAAPFEIDTSGWMEGNRIIQVYALDIAGNLNTTWYNFTIDGTSPSITIFTPENNSCVVPGTWLRFNITDPNLNISSIDYSINGLGPYNFIEPYNITTATWLDGDNVVEVNATDYLGNLKTHSFNITIDSTPPEIYLIFPGNNSAITKATVLDFNIYDENLEAVNYTVNFSLSYPLIPPFEINATAFWEDGPYTIQIFAIDKAGNTNSSFYEFLMATPPTITMISPQNNSIIKAGVLINLDISDTNLNHTNYSINGGGNIPFGPPYDFVTGNWLDGDYTIEIYAIDEEGNSNSSMYFISVDAQKPQIILNLYTNNSYIPPGPVLDFMVSDINLVSVNYSINGSAFIPFSPPYDIPTAGWSDDTYTIIIEAADAAGRYNKSTFVITIDSKAPEIQLLSPPNGTSSEIGILINLSIIDDNLDYVDYSINNGANISLFSPFKIDTSLFPDGFVILTIYAFDLAGNFNSTFYEFTFDDNTKPLITLISPGNQSYIPQGTIIDFDVYDLYLSDVSYSLDGGSFIPFPDPYDINTAVWSEGEHTVVVWANDTRSNTNTSTIIITIDSELPLIFLSPSSPSNNSVVPPGAVLDFHIDEDNLDIVNYSINGGIPQVFSSPWDLDTTGWQDDIYTIEIHVADKAGNINVKWFRFTIDSTPPSIQLNSPADGSFITSGTAIDFEVIDNNLEEVIYSINSGIDTQFFTPFDIDTTGWGEGNYSVKVHASDTIDNVEDVTFHFMVDNTPPEVHVYVSAPFYPNKFTRIHIYFSEEMDNESVESALSIVPSLNYTLEWSDDYQTLTLVDIDGLQLNVQYLIDLRENATDLAGNPLYNFTGYQYIPTDPNSTPEEDGKGGTTLQFWWLIPILVGLLVVAIILFILLIQERKEEPKGPVEQVENIYLAMRAQKDISTMEGLIKKEIQLGDNIEEAKIMVRKAKEAFEKGEYTAITVYVQTLKDLVGEDVEGPEESRKPVEEKTEEEQ
jgi:parallel beta-helix repeat protein